jgi:hypothetical protein
VITNEMRTELFNALVEAVKQTMTESAESGPLKQVSNRFGALGVKYSLVIDPGVTVLIEEETEPVVQWHSDQGKKL